MTGTKSIQLQLNSTCLTFSRPYALPYLDNRFAFRADELEPLFPRYVIDYLVEEGREILARSKEPFPEGCFPLPVGEKLPIIVAVRMSLSFPILFTPIPLLYRNYHEKKEVLERVYFADGGITSNLPINFFDSPFPRWPTLAVNLQYARQPSEFGRRNIDSSGVWMAKSNSDGTLEMFNRFLEAKSSFGKLVGLVSAIFKSAQVWTDNSFLVLPGFRDRVAEIWLNPDEGGLNLDMPEDVINRLIERGAIAGRKLVERFAESGSGKMSWDGHRLTRYRATMAALAQYLRGLKRGIENPLPDDCDLWTLLSKAMREDDSLESSESNETSAEEKAMRELIKFIKSLDAYDTCLTPEDAPFRPFCNGPKPRISLQARATPVPFSTETRGSLGETD